MRKKIIFIVLIFGLQFCTCVYAGDIEMQGDILGLKGIREEIEINPKVIKVIDKKDDKRTIKKTQKKLTAIEKYQKKISNLGVLTLGDDPEECACIVKEPNKKAKTVGYVMDGCVVTVIEQVDAWYKVKSGKIEGYIPTKQLAVDEDVESILLENECIEATFIKNNVQLKSQSEGSDTAIGMGYQGRTYPVIGFSDDGKKIRIQRTETIAGWVPISSVKIEINAEGAMSKSELKAYQEQLQREQEQISQTIHFSVQTKGNELVDKIVSLVAHNESGNYTAARNALPQFPGEKTITVGAWQWYGERAHSLLRNICSQNTDKAKKMIRESFTGTKKKQEEKFKKLYFDIKSGDNWETSRRKFTKEELVAIKSLLGSDAGRKVQNAQIRSELSAKIQVAKSTYKLTDDKLIAYFCDLFWQSPENARAITKKCITHFKSAKAFCKAKDGLKYMHETAMKNSVMGKFSRRRNYTYAVCRKIK